MMRVLLDTPIRFDVPGGISHAPMIDAVVGTIATRLIIDTGSSDHVLTIDLVRAIGSDPEPGESGTDHAGESVPSWTVGDLSITIADVGFDLRDVVAIAGPAPFAGWGVGGFLSPQHIHPTADAVIDLVDDRFMLIDGPSDAVDRWLVDHHPGFVARSLQRSADDQTPVIRAAIDDFDPVPAMLNTGGRGSEFASWAVPGLEGRPDDEPGHGVGGSAVIGVAIEGRSLTIADRTFSLERLLIRDEIEALGGLIGMDVLRGSVLVVAADRQRPVRWLVGDTPP
jgi:hypothetical protein